MQRNWPLTNVKKNIQLDSTFGKKCCCLFLNTLAIRQNWPLTNGQKKLIQLNSTFGNMKGFFFKNTLTMLPNWTLTNVKTTSRTCLTNAGFQSLCR
jgi:hypothetical protein